MTGQPTSANTARIGLAILFIIALVNYVDRSIFSILQVPIKRDLELSDTQLGALTGLSFALFYTVLALPIARIADRVPRKLVITAALLVWSGMTACSGVAGSFLVLLFLRMGVAAGEAGCVPTTHSMLSDYFPLHRRATAIAIWGLSLPVGYMLGYVSGGWLTEALGWRHAFIIVGGAGVVLTPLAYFVLREPLRGQFDAARTQQVEPPPLGVAIARLWRLRAFRLIAFGGALHAYSLHTLFSWNAPFFSRVHHVPIGETAFYLALCVGVGGGAGTFLGGFLADRLARRDVRWFMWTPALAAMLAVPLSLGQYFSADPALSFVFAGAVFVILSVYQAPLVGTSQSLVEPGMRAFASATIVMVVNILGMGLGPFVTGALSDYLAENFGAGEFALRFAMSTTVIFTAGAGYLFYRAARYLPLELPSSGAETRPREASEPRELGAETAASEPPVLRRS
jgi:predicted MFS family arabinose efflux permease